MSLVSVLTTTTAMIPTLFSMLLAIDGVDVNVSNKTGQTPLYVAVQQENREIVERLLQHKSVSINQPSTVNVT